MTDNSNREHAVELLQQLGQKEYEARCFTALCRLPTATAKEIGEISDVPRTRVYDAIRVLEEYGLVEVQHTSPQQFRAVAIDEAVETLCTEYEERTATLGDVLRELPGTEDEQDEEAPHEVWSLSGETAITSRLTRLLGEAEDEVVLVLGSDAVAYRPLLEAAREHGSDVSVLVGVASAAFEAEVEAALPDAEVCLQKLPWLEGNGEPVGIGRVALVDDEVLLLSSLDTRAHSPEPRERAVCCRGGANGLVVLLRRLLTTEAQ